MTPTRSSPLSERKYLPNHLLDKGHYLEYIISKSSIKSLKMGKGIG